MSTKKGVYRGRNVDDGESGSLAGRAPLPEDRQLDDRNDYPTASTSGTSRPKGNYNPPSFRGDDGGRRNDDRGRGRYDDRDRDRPRDRDWDRHRDRDDRSTREDKFAKQRAPPVAVAGKGEYRREDREARRPASPTAGSRRPREQEEAGSSYYPRRENGNGDYGSQKSNDRVGDQDWQSKRPRLEDNSSEHASNRRSEDASSTSNQASQANAKGKGVYVRAADRDREDRDAANDRKAVIERKVWPPPGWDEEKERYRREQRNRENTSKKGNYTKNTRRSPSPHRDRDTRSGNYRPAGGQGRDRDRDRPLDRSRRSSRSRSRSRSRSPGTASSLRTGRSPSPASSIRSPRTSYAGGTALQRSRWDARDTANGTGRRRSRSRSPGYASTYQNRNSGRRASSPGRRGRSPSPINAQTYEPPPSAGYDPLHASQPLYEPLPQQQNQWPPHGQSSYSLHSNGEHHQQHNVPPFPPPNMQHPQQQQQGFPPPHPYPQSAPPVGTPAYAWSPPTPINVDPHHFPMPPGMNSAPPPVHPSPIPYSRPENFPSRDAYNPADAYPARSSSFPTPDSFPPMQFPPGQYPPPPGQFPMPPSHFPGMPPPHATQPQPIPLPYPPPIPPPGLHEGPSAADRNLSISFRQSPPIGSSQSPPGNMQGLPERQLSVGIRAPPPGPNRAGGKFKPIAGFAAVESVTPPADRGQLGRFFPDDEDSQAQQPSPAMHPQAQAAVQKLEEDQSNAWARWEAPTQQNPTQQGQQSAAGPTGSIQTAAAEQTEQQSQSYIPLPTAHAPVFPGLILPTPTVAQVNGSNALPPSPGKDQSKSFPSGLPSKPNFAGNLLPAFLPQKPGSLPSSSDTAVQHQLPLPPIPLASPSSAGTSQGEALPDALAKFRPRMMHKASSRSDKAEDSAVEDIAATKQSIVTPQTPSQALDQTASAKEASQSAQHSPAPSEVAQSKQSPSKGEGVTDRTVGHEAGQQGTPSQSAPRIVSSELYERLAQVGEGTYGKVYKARRQDTGKLVALKRIRMEAEKDGFPVTAIREIKLLQSLDHPNVLKLMEMMVSKGHVYMVSEYLEHDLTGILNNPNMQSNKFTDANLKSLMQQLLAGLDYIHWRGVLHRDLKGSNILLGRNGDLKIADFGLAKFYDKRARNDYTNRVITLWYKPPELLFGETVYGPEVDMWSAGCIFLELFTKKPVFQGQDELHQLDVIFRYMGTPSTDTWPEVTSLPWYELVKPKHSSPSQFKETFAGTYLKSPLAIELAEALLSFNPVKRPTAAEALQMPYFTSDTEPKAEKPTWLADIKGDWHEMESKEANKRKGREARKAAQQMAQQQHQQQQQQQT